MNKSAKVNLVILFLVIIVMTGMTIIWFDWRDKTLQSTVYESSQEEGIGISMSSDKNTFDEYGEFNPEIKVTYQSSASSKVALLGVAKAYIDGDYIEDIAYWGNCYGGKNWKEFLYEGVRSYKINLHSIGEGVHEYCVKAHNLVPLDSCSSSSDINAAKSRWNSCQDKTICDISRVLASSCMNFEVVPTYKTRLPIGEKVSDWFQNIVLKIRTT